MNGKINLLELLRDCPKGMELDCTMYDNVYFDKIDESYSYPIGCYTMYEGFRTTINFTKYGTFNIHGNSKCVIFPKGKTTWKGFKRPFKNGDIVAFDTEEGVQLFMFKEYIYDRDVVQCHMMLDYDGEVSFDVDDYYVERLATEEEKQKIFKVIKDNGYGWNAETKTLEKLVEPKIKLEKGKWYVCKKDLLDNCANKAFHKGDTHLSTQDGSLIPSNSNVPFEVACPSTYFRDWTIQDAKDGDVICYDDGWTCIFKCIHGIWFSSYCFMTDDGEFHTGYESHSVSYSRAGNVYPATKEQRDLLFQKMKEAGYRWITETKTLEKVVEPRFKAGDRVVKKNGISVPISITGVGDEFYYSNTANSVGVFRITEQDDWVLVPDKFDISTLKPFESRVLVRSHDTDLWKPSNWGGYNEQYSPNFPYITTYGAVAQCIPYDGNESLINTTNDCSEFYKTWKKKS